MKGCYNCKYSVNDSMSRVSDICAVCNYTKWEPMDDFKPHRINKLGKRLKKQRAILINYIDEIKKGRLISPESYQMILDIQKMEDSDIPELLQRMDEHGRI